MRCLLPLLPLIPDDAAGDAAGDGDGNAAGDAAGDDNAAGEGDRQVLW